MEIRRHSSSNEITHSFVESSYHDARPYSAIPGPLRVPVFGTLLPYKLGFKSITNYHKEVFNLYRRYGPLVRERIGATDVIHVFDPADIRQVFQNDGKYPRIPPLQETTQFYRQVNDMSPGLGNVNGDEWYRMRRVVQQKMLKPIEVGKFLPLQDSVAQEAVEYINCTKDNCGMVPELHFAIARWILESAGMCCFERPLGALRGGDTEDLAQKLVQADRDIFKLSGDLKLSLKLYRLMRMPKYEKLQHLTSFFYGTSIQWIEDTIEHVNALLKEGSLVEGQYNFLTYLISKDDLDRKDAISLTLSLLTDGLSATAQTLLANIHCLALNPEYQERLYEEIEYHIDPNFDITVDTLKRMHYLKAFVKEVFRFYPIGESVQRITQKDLILSGYQVPAYTRVDLNAYIWLQNEAHFSNPHEFSPERWLREEMSGPIVDPYVFTPFSFGTRMCVGRRFAEQDLYVSLCRLLQKFRIAPVDESPPQQDWMILLRPKIPIRVKFLSRQITNKKIVHKL